MSVVVAGIAMSLKSACEFWIGDWKLIESDYTVIRPEHCPLGAVVSCIRSIDRSRPSDLCV